MKTPSIGRIVHFQVGTTTLPALVTALDPSPAERPCVSLCVFSRKNVLHLEHVPYNESPAHNCWSWPPFVPAGAE